MSGSVPPRPDLPAEGALGVPPSATWRPIEALPVGLIWLVGTAILTTIIALAFFPHLSADELQDEPGFYASANIIGELVLLLSVVVWVRWVNHGRLEPLGLPPRRPLVDLATGVVAGVGMVFTAGIVLQLTRTVVDAVAGHHVSNPEQVPKTVEGALLAVSGIAVVGLAPLAEETFFRGFLYKSLRRRFAAWSSAIISGFFFGLVHASGGLRFFLIVPPLIVVGVLLALVYERRQSLLASVATHATFNLIGFVFIVTSRR
jgi:membrane protease YdiL (CAAX protease family)